MSAGEAIVSLKPNEIIEVKRVRVLLFGRIFLSIRCRIVMIFYFISQTITMKNVEALYIDVTV